MGSPHLGDQELLAGEPETEEAEVNDKFDEFVALNAKYGHLSIDGAYRRMESQEQEIEQWRAAAAALKTELQEALCDLGDAEARIKELEEGLGPFADLCEQIDERYSDYPDQTFVFWSLTHGHLRRARSLLKGGKS